MTSSLDISLFINDHDGNVLLSEKADKMRESSSTIKLPVLLIALRKMIKEGRQLHDSLDRLPRHNTQGSGVLNWTAANSFSFKDLIYTTIVYSDCLATNILLDYIGGQPKVNSWLKANGLATRLQMQYLYFSGDDDPLPHVGTTTAREMALIFQLLDCQDLSRPIHDLVSQALHSINESWLESNLPEPIPGLRHKTGSMINCGPDGDTVYNASGTFYRQQQQYYFCILSSGQIDKNQSVDGTDPMRQYVTMYFTQAVKNL